MGNGRSFVAPAQIDDDNTFRSWSRQMHQSIINVGLTDVSASGAISSSDFSDVSAPGGTNSPAGYKVYRFNDALQSDLPVFIKIEFGTGAATTRQAIWITVGATHNGSGSVTGSNPQTSRHMLANSANDANPHQWFVGGDSNYLTLTGPVRDLQDQGDGPNTFTVSVERTKDTAGQDTFAGILVGMVSAATTYAWYTLPRSGSIPAAETEYPMLLATTSPATFEGRQIVSPAFPFVAISGNPGINLLGSMDSNFTDLDIVPVEIYEGVSATYVKLSTNASSNPANAPNGCILLRWT